MDESLRQQLAVLASRHAGLHLLLLHGSRATNRDLRPDSDWDFGYLAEERFDPEAVRVDFVRALNTEQIDLVDLARAGAQLRFRAARDARVIFSSRTDVFPRFWHEAVEFWCDAGPLLQQEYSAILEDLTRR